MQFFKNVDCALFKKSILNDSVKPIIMTVSSSAKPPNCVRHVNIVNAVTSALHIPIKFHFDSAIGKLVKGKWNGAIGRVANNESDLAIGRYTVTYERFQLLQFSTPLGYSSPVTILSGRLSQHSMQNEFQVFNTFSSVVWLLLFISVLMVGLFNYFLPDRYLKFNHLISSIIQSFKCAFGQSVEQFSRICCLKHVILIGTSLLCFNIIIHCFKALILTNLLSDPLIKIDSINDLVDFIRATRANITLASSTSYMTWQLFKDSEDENFRTIFKRLKNQNYNIKDIINGKSIYIGYGFVIEKTIKSNQHPSLYIGRQQYFGSPFAVLYTKSFDKTLKEKIDSVVSTIFESGLFNLWTLLVPYKRPKETLTETENHDTIRMDDIKGIMMLLAIIYLLVIFSLIFENLSKILLNTQNTNQTKL